MLSFRSSIIFIWCSCHATALQRRYLNWPVVGSVHLLVIKTILRTGSPTKPIITY